MSRDDDAAAGNVEPTADGETRNLTAGGATSVLAIPRRAAVLAGLATTQLRRERLRTGVAVCAIALAVLATTLLAAGGVGVLEVGQQQFNAADRDLWVTGGPVGLTPAGGGGLEATLHDAHPLAADIASHEDVAQAAPMSFQTVYVGTDPSDLESTVATGVPGADRSISVSSGRGFEGQSTHYANGTYEGPMTGELIVDEATADRHDLEVGDSVHVGGSIATARQHEYEVVGVSNTFSGFLGTETVTLRLDELQTLTGTAGTDAATMITVALEDGADPEAVEADLQANHEEYEVRTNREQLERVLAGQATVVAGAALLVGLAVVAGAALTVSLLSLHVYQHRRELWTLGAMGVSRRTVVGFVVAQGLLLGLVGWLLGAVLTVPLARLLNAVVERIVGFEGLVVVPPRLVLASGVLALGIGALAAAVAAWRVPRVDA